MLSFEERLLLLQEELAVTPPEKVLAELQSYEAKGPIACDGLDEVAA